MTPGVAGASGRSFAARRWLWLFLLIALVRGCLYTLLVPPWQQPDEPTHFEHARLIAETGSLPSLSTISLPVRQEIAHSMRDYDFWEGLSGEPPLDDAALTARHWVTPIGITTFAHPRLYYVLAGYWLRPWLGLPVQVQLYAVRLLSVLLSLLAVAMGYCAARLLFPGWPAFTLGVLGFMVFHPAYTANMASSNNDVLVNLLGAGLFLTVAVIYGRRQAWRWLLVPVCGLLIGVSLMTKTTGVILVLCVPLAVLVYLWPRSWRERWGRALAAFVMAALVAGAAVYALLLSDPGNLNRMIALLARYLRIDVRATWAALVGLARPQLPYDVVFRVVFRSFWAAFGWRHVLLADVWYWGPTLATIGAFLGLAWQALRYLRGSRREGEGWQVRYIVFCVAAVLVAWSVAVLRGQAVQDLGRPYYSHGRYAFIAMLPFAILFAKGWLGIMGRRWSEIGVVVYLVALVAFDGLCLWGLLAPYYYGG